MRIYWIKEPTNSQLGMMARPRGNDWLADEIKKLKNYRVDEVVSLLELHEIQALELEQEAFFCAQNNISYTHFPIPDRGVPNIDQFIQLITAINTALKSGKKIVIHCRMGIGRTALVAAGILLLNNGDPKTVFNVLSETRTLNVPDTNEQKEWLVNQAEKIIKKS